MNSSNLTVNARKHLLAVKGESCIVCGAAGPSDAHHVHQGSHFTCLPLCKDCHQNPRLGIHGEGYAWKLRKIDEWKALNALIERMFYGR
jgi:hypothetical protein